jgi:hypothetical protein
MRVEDPSTDNVAKKCNYMTFLLTSGSGRKRECQEVYSRRVEIKTKSLVEVRDVYLWWGGEEKRSFLEGTHAMHTRPSNKDRECGE